MDRKNHTPSGNKEVYSDKHQTSVYVKANRKNLAFSLQIRKKKDGINLGQIIFYREIIYIWNTAMNRNLIKELNDFKLLD